MTIIRVLKTIFLVEFIVAAWMGIKEIFKTKKTINYPYEKGLSKPKV